MIIEPPNEEIKKNSEQDLKTPFFVSGSSEAIVKPSLQDIKLSERKQSQVSSVAPQCQMKEELQMSMSIVESVSKPSVSQVEDSFRSLHFS